MQSDLIEFNHISYTHAHLVQIEFSLFESRINCTPSINGIWSAELTSSNRIKLFRLKQDQNIPIDSELCKHLSNILFAVRVNTSHESAGVPANKPLMFKIKINTNENFCTFKLKMCILNRKNGNRCATTCVDWKWINEKIESID